VKVKARNTLRRGNIVCLPFPKIVASGLARAEHRDVLVFGIEQEFLNGLVGAIGVADDNMRAARGDILEALLRYGRETRNLPGPANENCIHWLLRVRVSVSARTLAAAPLAFNRSVMAFKVEPDRNRSSNRSTLRPFVWMGST